MSTGPLYAMGGAHPHALERNNAMRGLATGLKTERPQDILTPQCVVDFVEALWCAPIQMDPCASRDPRSVVNAEQRIYDAGGLDVDWLDRTYINPPFKFLKAWMRYAVAQSDKFPNNRLAMLAPTRGNRVWWHECRDTAQCVLELKPLKFIGYPGAFPAPLSLLLWGPQETLPAGVGGTAAKAKLGVTKITWL